MIREYVLRGVVVNRPVVIRTHLQFLLRTDGGIYAVIRTAPGWQKRDVVFLSPGQTVEVTGTPASGRKIIARRIVITDIGPVQKRRDYGNSGK